LKNKTMVVTGVTGSWGRELVKRLLEREPKIMELIKEAGNRDQLMNRTGL
jgi:FlaA1/EpsC-like NDP-sugar epimerase